MKHESEPVFVIEHELEIAASAEATWAVLADIERYGEWNPYVLELNGQLTPGAVLAVTISQTNWPEPITVQPTVLYAEPNRILHWQGRLGDGGVLDTDHVFEIHPLDENRIRFHHYEEFRGTHAENMDELNRVFIREAFEAMNTALAAQVES